MKKQLLTLKKKKGYILLIILMSLMSQIGIAQGTFPNVRVNDVTTGDQITEGSHLISVLEDSVYVVWQDERAADTINVYFSKSIDKGATFAPGILVSNIPDTVSQLFPTIAVDNSGVVYVAWTVVSCDMLNLYGIWLAKSLDGGISFEPAVQIFADGIMPSLSVYGNNVYALFANPINYPMVEYYFARSTNGGTSFEPAYQINDVNCTVLLARFEAGLTSLCVDGAGNIYAAWNDCRRLEGNSDIYFAKSTNTGISFEANVPVNDITVQAGDSIQYHPSIAVGGIDTVFVTWTDLRYGSDFGGDERVYYSMSINGGTTFDADIMLSDNILSRKSDITASSSGFVYVTWEGDGIWVIKSDDGGLNFYAPVAYNDTFNVESSKPSIFIGQEDYAYLVWQDKRLGEDNIYFSKSLVNTNIEENNNNQTSFILLESYPNPFNQSTTISYTLTTDEQIEIKIYNIQGQLVKRFDCGKKSSGKHTVYWDGKDDKNNNVSTGTYFCYLKTTIGNSKLLKMNLIR